MIKTSGPVRLEYRRCVPSRPVLHAGLALCASLVIDRHDRPMTETNNAHAWCFVKDR